MKTRRWAVRLGLALLAWAAIGSGIAEAQGIAPVSTSVPFSPISSPSVTISILQNGQNVTNTWLPEPGQPVELVVNVGGVPDPSATIALVCPDGSTVPTCASPSAAFNPITAIADGVTGTLRTSAYPGVCTNFGSASDPAYFATDFTFDPLTRQLTPTDCGGMAVVRVTVAAGTFTFVIPQDSDFDGIPDIYEARFGAASGPGSLIRDADPDADGISAFDEYRGFIVSGKHVRTDPTQKDLFLHLVNPADSIGGVFVVSGNCGTSCLGGGTTTYPAPTTPNATLTLPATAGTLGGVGTFTTNAAVFSTAHAKGEIIAGLGRARIVTVTSSTSVTAEVTAPFAPGAVSAGAWALRESLFANVYSLVPAERVHLLGYAFGATNALTTEWVDNFVSLVPSQTLTISGPGDRTVNANRLYGSAQKGIRIMEGLNTNNPATLGWAFGTGSPNSVGNIILFTQRSVTYIAGLISDGAGASLRYSSFVNGGWSTPTLVGNGDPANDDVRNFIFSRAIQYYLAMEVAHSLDLTPTENTTQKTSYGYHYAPYTGDCVDQAITTKIKGGFNTFYIPSICGLTDQSQFMISP